MNIKPEICEILRIWEQYLESTQEARLLRALQTSRVLHNSIVHAKAWTNC